MKHSRSRAAGKKELPYYFNLNFPEDKKAAEITAMTSSMNAAVACAAGRCSCQAHRFINHLDVSGQEMLALNLSQLYSNTVADGKRGVNDLGQFNAIFRGIVPRAYLSFLSFLQASPDALEALRDLSERERLTTLNAAAEAQLHLLALPFSEPLSLTWPAPEQKSEVQDGSR
ncbi:MAG: hypothetical protein ACJ788_16595 [Ktedonobacteraceae bacterium]